LSSRDYGVVAFLIGDKMLNIKSDEVQRWRVEIELAEEFRKKNFGVYEGSIARGAGENLEYYERGDIASGTISQGVEERPYTATLNLVYTVAKTVVPALYYRNPRVLAFPKRKQDEDSAPIAANLLNHYFNELNIKETNQLVILDAFLLGIGISKIGYATQFGMDIPDEDEVKRREKSKTRKILESLGFKKPQKEEKKQNVELQENIIAENPYVIYVNPFNFLIDPRATSIYDAQWVAHKIIKTLDEVKKNKNFKNTGNLKGQDPVNSILKDVPTAELDRFKTIDLYEIHYKTDEGMNILIIAKDGQRYEYLFHDKSIYEMDGFQFELLSFNKHGHKLYPKSDVDIVKSLQDRLTMSFDSILDQVDKFVEKLGVDETGLTEQGKLALTDGQLGSIVYTNRDPNTVMRETKFIQLKADMLTLVNQIVDIIILESGLTRAQLTGLTTAETATEAQIGQGGANLRLFARADAVQDFSNRQARKLWQVIRQFVDLENIEIITGEEGTDEQGIPKFQWLADTQQINSETLAKAELRFKIEVGSTQKPDVAVVRKEWENFINIMARTDVVALMQQQGDFIHIAELIRLYLKQFPELIIDTGRIIKRIGQQTAGTLPPEAMMAHLAKLTPGGGPGQAGINENLRRAPTPTPTSMAEQVGGEAGAL